MILYSFELNKIVFIFSEEKKFEIPNYLSVPLELIIYRLGTNVHGTTSEQSHTSHTRHIEHNV